MVTVSLRQAVLRADIAVAGSSGRALAAAQTLVADREWLLAMWLPLVLELVDARYRSNAGTARKLSELIERCCSFLEAHGKRFLNDIDADTFAEWYWAPSRDHRTGRLRPVAGNARGTCRLWCHGSAHGRSPVLRIAAVLSP